MLWSISLSLMIVSKNPETGCMLFIRKPKYHHMLVNFKTLWMLFINFVSMRNYTKFCAVWKPMIRLEVSKDGPVNFEQAVRVALKVDNPLYRPVMLNSFRSPLYNAGPQRMDFENIERKGNNRRKNSKDNSTKHGNSRQGQTDFAKNTCFEFRKDKCRAWKRKDGSSMVDNAEVNNVAFSISRMENKRVHLKLSSLWLY